MACALMKVGTVEPQEDETSSAMSVRAHSGNFQAAHQVPFSLLRLERTPRKCLAREQRNEEWALVDRQ